MLLSPPFRLFIMDFGSRREVMGRRKKEEDGNDGFYSYFPFVQYVFFVIVTVLFLFSSSRTERSDIKRASISRRS